jgi:myo-inositol-1-phosphate synthase
VRNLNADSDDYIVGFEHEIKVAVAGVGSAISGMLQAIQLYKQGNGQGLLHPVLNKYSPSDVEVVAAFDVDKRKTGKELRDALFVDEHSLHKFAEVTSSVRVEPGILQEKGLNKRIEVSTSDFDTVVNVLRRSGAEILINAINGGLDGSSRLYAEAALKAGLAFINITPTPIATDVEIEEAFSKSNLPLLGDDLLSQIGGTVFHAYILSFLNSRGVKISQTYQLDVGGGLENQLTVDDDELRLKKRAIKTMAVTSVLPYPVKAATGTTEYVDFMGNSRDSHFEVVGEYVLGAPIEIEITLRSIDGANAAGPLLDAVRAAKVALNKKIAGAIERVNPYLFKMIRTSIDPFNAEKEFVEFMSDSASGVV